MNGFFAEITRNRVLITAIAAWISAQIIKVIIQSIVQKKFAWTWFIESGNMPSSHSAMVVSSAFTIGLYAGFDSMIFGLGCVVALIVMYDAAGVRRSSGQQAQLLNNVVEHMIKTHEVDLVKVQEIIGHKPTEVLMGSFWGILVAFLIHLI